MAVDPSEWGLFTEDGEQLVPANTVLGVEVSNPTGIADYPQQNGAFMSYNKVIAPTLLQLRYGIADSDDARREVIEVLDDARYSLSVYTLGMPEFSYPSVNVVDYRFRRSSREGAKFLQLEVFCQEVRILGPKFVRFGKSVNSQTGVENGTVQADSVADIPGVPGFGGQLDTSTGTLPNGVSSDLTVSPTRQFESQTSGLSSYNPEIGSIGFTPAKTFIPEVIPLDDPVIDTPKAITTNPDGSADIWFDVPAPR